ncbi:bifunctional adenosylcobinamide kinase/adenosylcobinamide-phosphate guanylyltransferase [Sphingobium sp. HWE2-09]|uniref:bifunctional adenosylcobinamide kinase/adenosylcobinamide-phosphate guanylyltransferase n=1 Tax=Sphingobium sp. HWE2-09 TaxID=3108390 RepID=UPI002DC6C80F|nr:bifunctional adenosylcobinamide kinase/adenosylcobinamide-phosphate guanylyltransferase [Sphingobium sp. HWE2-09]
MIHKFEKSLLVLGGARSGKSRFAQAQAEALPGDLIYIATAQAFDSEMEDRIARHRATRGPRWRTVDAPIALAAAITDHSRADVVILVDCLTLWASNLLLGEEDVPSAITALTSAIAHAPGRIILVTNEVGLGIVPDNALARRFRDMAGDINQAVAACADSAIFVAAGLPMVLK